MHPPPDPANDNSPALALHPAALWLAPLTRQGVATELNRRPK